MTAATPSQAAAAVRDAAPLGISCRRTSSCPHIHLDVRPMHAIRFYQPGDLTVGADAGVTVAQLNAALAEHHQFVPLDIPAPETTTLGAVLAQCLSGPLRHRFGSVRDFTIGLEMIASGGSLVHCGGRVVKNVAGYDWMKPVIGNHGALGIITGVNFKVFPLPQDFETARIGPLSWPQVELVRTALLHSPLRPLALELRVTGSERTVSVTYAGSAAVQARYRAELQRLRLPLELCPGAAPTLAPQPNFAVPPAASVAALEALGEGTVIAGRLGLGVWWVNPLPEPAPFPPPLDALQRRLKSALDPAGIFHGDACA
ncbi:MAG: FAD-binding oxidoreductase [Terriglobales bacterium]